MGTQMIFITFDDFNVNLKILCVKIPYSVALWQRSLLEIGRKVDRLSLLLEEKFFTYLLVSNYYLVTVYIVHTKFNSS